MCRVANHFVFLSVLLITASCGGEDATPTPPVNSVPNVQKDVVSTGINKSVSISVLANDDFGDDGPSSSAITLVSSPQRGTATINTNGTPANPTDDKIDYTPETHFSGTISFSYNICDADGDCATTTVTVNVVSEELGQPTAVDDSADIGPGQRTRIAVLANDTFGPDGTANPAIRITSTPANGSAVVYNNASPTNPTDDKIEYQPASSFSGTDTFAYTLCDADNDCSTATVIITVGNQIFPALSGMALLTAVKDAYRPTLSPMYYSEAREEMYTNIDLKDGNEVSGVYSNYTVALPQNFVDNIDFNQLQSQYNINTEHVFPQSMGAGQEPQKADIHHLFPSHKNVNSARSNFPFDEINDNATDRWYYQAQSQQSIPATDIDFWSELDSYTAFEPREAVKGDIARATFYFYVIYNSVANESYFNGMVSQLLLWHDEDPVDATEIDRNDKIEAYQGNFNPFILDSSLADRIF